VNLVRYENLSRFRVVFVSPQDHDADLVTQIRHLHTHAQIPLLDPELLVPIDASLVDGIVIPLDFGEKAILCVTSSNADIFENLPKNSVFLHFYSALCKNEK